MAYQRPDWHQEWTEQKAEIKIQIAELCLSEDYEPEAIQAALFEYIEVEFKSSLKERFGEKYGATDDSPDS